MSYAYRQKFLVEKVIGNAEDEAEEEFIIESDRTFNINIAVTDNDWEQPLDEDVSTLEGKGGSYDAYEEEGKEGVDHHEGKRKVGFDTFQYTVNGFFEDFASESIIYIHTYVHTTQP